MRIFRFLMILTVCVAGLSAVSHAKPKPWVWGWWPSHWQGLDFKPYLGQQQIRQRSLWDGDAWTPEAWVKEAGDAKRIIRDFYETGIIVDQYENSDNIPVLKVGETFVRLSGVDRRRVLKFVDHTFGITTAEEFGMFYVYYDQNDEDPMGVFNKYGFQQY